MTPRLYGSYELLRLFARGGTSELWLARPRHHRGEDRPLILKRILPHLADDPEATELFLLEAKLGVNLQHPNIVRILEFGEADRSHYIAREFVDGEALNTVQLLAQDRPDVLSQHRALHIIASVCEALAYAYHRVDHLDRPRKLMHREISARHILIGNDGVVKVFGFIGDKVPEPELLMRGGRFDCMAPEQIRGLALDHRTDIFTTGLLLYELLTGVRPFKRLSGLETVRAVIEDPLPLPSQVAPVPEALDAVVMKALAKAPDDRYQDPRDFQRALEEYLAAQRAEVGPADLSAMMQRLFTKGEGTA